MKRFLPMNRSLFLVIVLVAGCATSSHTPQTDSSKAFPSFSDSFQVSSDVLRHYPETQYQFGVGQAKSEQAAIELARADLAKKIRVHVTAAASDLVRERGGHTDQFLGRMVTTQANELIRGTIIVDLHRVPDSEMVQAVVALPRSEIDHFTQPHHDSAGQHAMDPVWVTAEGRVPFGIDTTQAEAAMRAREKARGQAVEKAVGAFVKGQTVVYNTTVTENVVRSLIRGIIIDEQILDEGMRSTGEGAESKVLVYVTKLRAKVKPLPLEQPNGFKIDVALNRTVFQEGDDVQIEVVPSHDAYVYILNVGQDDKVTMLFPNKFAHKNFLTAQHEFVFPDETQLSMGIRLRAALPQGERKAIEKVKIVASQQQFDLLEETRPKNSSLPATEKSPFTVTDLMKRLASLEDTTWTETTIPYEIRR